jgi:hypothetical protein
MNHSFHIALISLGLLACVALDASAAGVNTRQARQHERIHAGVEQGQLTARESAALHRQQARIARTEARMRADDGVLGPRERARLDQRQDRASRSIRRQRADHQHR